jgi:thioredoxin 1
MHNTWLIPARLGTSSAAEHVSRICTGVSNELLTFLNRELAVPFAAEYRDDEPTRAQIDTSTGLMVLEFGAGWCGHCLALSPTLDAVLSQRPAIQHIRIADGRGKPLGRSFRVKLWPTLVLLRDGSVIDVLVRPSADELRRAIGGLQPG